MNASETQTLHWFPELGYGWYPVCANVYDEAYLEKYRRYAQTDLGRALTQARIDFVARHYTGPLVDIGCGAGQFVEARPQTRGWDINPAVQRWLCERNLCHRTPISSPAASFWDSLEHIPDPGSALRQVNWWAFVSLPIFESMEHVLRSRHFRRDEHFFYWTKAGFQRWVGRQGFTIREVSDMETQLGREDILSFALERT